jgi:hypothetical protein
MTLIETPDACQNRYGKARCFVCGTGLVARRSTRRYCADACRQSAYRRRRSPKVWHRRAGHARIHPVSRATVSLAQAVVRPIPIGEARPVIESHEPMAGVPTLAFGLFIGGTLASVVVFGVHPIDNLRQDYRGTIALLRGVTMPWAPRNCGSKLIRGAMRMLPAPA